MNNSFIETGPMGLLSSDPGAGIDARKEMATHRRVMPQSPRMRHRRPGGVEIETILVPNPTGSEPLMRARVIVPGGGEDTYKKKIRLVNPRYNILDWSGAALGPGGGPNTGAVALTTTGTGRWGSINALEVTTNDTWTLKDKFYQLNDGTVPGEPAGSHGSVWSFWPPFFDHNPNLPDDVPLDQPFALSALGLLNYVAYSFDNSPNRLTHPLIDILFDVSIVTIKNEKEIVSSELVPVRFSIPFKVDYATEGFLFDSTCTPDPLVGAPVTCALNSTSSNLLPNAGSHCCDYVTNAHTEAEGHFGTELVHPIKYPNTGWDTSRQDFFEVGGVKVKFEHTGLAIWQAGLNKPTLYGGTFDDSYYDAVYEHYGYPTDYDYGDPSGWPLRITEASAPVYTTFLPLWRNITQSPPVLCRTVASANAFYMVGKFTLP